MNLSPFMETKARIAEAERRYGREAGSVQLLAVTKTRTAAEIRAVAALGQYCFAENYLQEALTKLDELATDDLEWHFIGAIQSNKTDAIAQHFAWVHTLDREKLARRLNDQRPAERPPLQVCIQINISDEETKSGIGLADLPEFAAMVAALPRLTLRGLMALPAPAPEFEQQRLPFRRLAAALRDLQQRGFDVDTLSMGTSDDFEAAIAEGATIVRLGTSIFGPRPPKAG
jgi:hypothetical protein